MKLLSPQVATSINDTTLDDLYFEIKEDLALLDNPSDIGEESLEAAAAYGVSGLKYISQKLGNLVTRLLLSLRNITEKIVLRHSAILVRWNNRINKNINRIDTNAFSKYVTKIVPHHILEKRIGALLRLHYVIDNIESICEATVNLNSEDWRTSEIMTIYNRLSDIGFDAQRFNLLKEVSSTYDNSRIKTTIEDLGYTLSNLNEIISKIKPIVHYADSGSVKRISTRFVAYSDKLLKYEESLNFNEDEISPSELEEKRHILKVKLARLWWVSHFIRATYVISDDIVIDVLKLCKIAEKCISKEDN